MTSCEGPASPRGPIPPRGPAPPCFVRTVDESALVSWLQVHRKGYVGKRPGQIERGPSPDIERRKLGVNVSRDAVRDANIEYADAGIDACGKVAGDVRLRRDGQSQLH